MPALKQSRGSASLLRKPYKTRDLARTVLADDFRTIDPSVARIVIVERSDRLLSGGFDPKLSKRALRQLVELGVEVRVGASVEAIDQTGVGLAGGERIDAATVLWTAGVKARGVARTLGTAWKTSSASSVVISRTSAMEWPR